MSKKSYLICDKITNFRIFTQHIPIFFQKYKTEIANRGQRQLMRNQGHKILKGRQKFKIVHTCGHQIHGQPYMEFR